MYELTYKDHIELRMLAKHDLVRYVKVQDKNPLIEVRFDTGIAEHWRIGKGGKPHWSGYVFDYPEEYPRMVKRVPINYEYEVFPNQDAEPTENFFIVQRRHIDKAKFIDLRLMVHEIVDTIEEFEFGEYPESELINDWNNLINDKSYPKHYYDGSLYAYMGSRRVYPGLMLQERFVSSILNDVCYWSGRTVKDMWNSPKLAYMAINRLIDSPREITLPHIFRELNRVEGLAGGKRFIPPSFYVALFEKLNLKGRCVHDPNPGNLSKALAAASMSIMYSHSDPTKRDDLEELNNFIKKQTGKDLISYNEKGFDVLILDNNLIKPFNEIPDITKEYHTSIVSLDKEIPNSIKVIPKPICAKEFCYFVKTINKE